MRAEVLRRMRAKGVQVTDETYGKATPLVDEQLGYEVARYVFGRPAEFRRRARDDRQLQTAVDLLHRAQSPGDLLSIAMAQASTAPVRRK